MDALRTHFLARTHVVVLDPDRVADAATRPSRDDDLEKFEDELAQLGFVLSLDLGMTIRRLPSATLEDLRSWIVTTLAATLGAHRPHVPLFRGFPSATPRDTDSLLARRILSWLCTRADQPCPWCGQTTTVGALDPCGHLVCRACWDGGNYAGCPICHRRVALGDPFIKAPLEAPRVTRSDGQLRLVHLALDLEGVARERLTQLVARSTPLPPDDRDELTTIINALGPRVLSWLPSKIAVRETMALCVARLWLVAPDRRVMRRATASHLRTATDVLRVSVVLMGGSAGLDEPISTSGKLGAIGRGLRRCVLEALDDLESQALVDDVLRHAPLWKRVGERLHPFELATQLPTAALAFAVVRGTKLGTATFELRAQAAKLERVRLDDDRVRVPAWAAPVEEALRAGDVLGAVTTLAERPGELLRRVDHLARLATPEALPTVVQAVATAARTGAPGMLLQLAAHLGQRSAPWSRRVFFPKGEVLKAWSAPDDRALLDPAAVATMRTEIHAALLARAETRPRFPRGILDRGLVDLLVPFGERSASRAKVAWPRGSSAALPADERLRLFLHWEQSPQHEIDLDLSVAMFDASWRHVRTCDFTNLRVVDGAAIHSGDLRSAPAPLGASEFVDLDLAPLAAAGVRHAVMIVFSYNAVAFDKLVHGFAGLMQAPAEGTHFDPRAVRQRFDLGGKSVILVPLTIDLGTRRMQWIDVHVASRATFNSVGSQRAAIAHLGKDFADLVASGARPTLWDAAAIHAAARANMIYVRERDGGFTQYRRRDRESSAARLARLHARDHDGAIGSLAAASVAPTWFALVTDGVAMPAHSEGYILDARTAFADGVKRLAAADLVAQLA